MPRSPRPATLPTLTLLLALALPGVAHADPKDDARRHFAAGLEAAQQRDYAAALERFLAAQAAYPHPATLYNIAKAYQDLGEPDEALRYFRLFRDAAPDQAAQVAPIIAQLEASLAVPAPVAPADEAPPRVVAGPTAEELARIEAIAEELQALKDAIVARAAEAPAEAAGVAEPSGATDPPEIDQPEVAEPRSPGAPVDPEAGFRTDAYERIVVTASRVGQDPLDSPSTLTVISADDIRLSAATTVPDLLRRVAGVDMMSLSAGQSDLGVRGFNRKAGNKVLILVDGRSTYMDFVGVTMWNTLPVQLEEIERVEVIRGPGSAVYGANAVTGVINIITRPPGEQPGNLLTVEAGAPGYARTSILSSGRTGRVSYRLSGGYHQMGRWARELAPGDLEVVDTFFDDQDTALQAFRAHGRIDGTFGDEGFASISGGITRGRNEYHNIGALPNYGFDGTDGYLRGDLAWGSLHLRAFWNSDLAETGPWYQSIGQARSLEASVDNDAVDLELEGPVAFTTGPVQHVLNLGVGYRYKRVAFDYLRGGFDNPYTEHHVAVFANEQATIGRLGLVASLRVDRHPLLQLSETVSPRGAVIYRLFDKTSLRATAGTAFRAPNSIESYMDWNLDNPAADGVFIRDTGGSEVLGTAALRPERIRTFELGVHDASSFFHTADLVVYVNQVRDLIDLDAMRFTALPYDPLANGFQVGETGWINTAPEYTGVGLEGDLALYPTDGLDLYTNVTVMALTETDPQTGETVRDRSASGLKANLGASYRTPYRADLSLEASWLGPQVWRLRTFAADGSIVIDEQPVDARVLISARVAARPLADESLELAASVWNVAGLLGQRFIEHPDGQPLGGMAYGTVSYRF